MMSWRKRWSLNIQELFHRFVLCRLGKHEWNHQFPEPAAGLVNYELYCEVCDKDADDKQWENYARAKGWGWFFYEPEFDDEHVGELTN